MKDLRPCFQTLEPRFVDRVNSVFTQVRREVAGDTLIKQQFHNQRAEFRVIVRARPELADV
jgi:hypothetical protein